MQHAQKLSVWSEWKQEFRSFQILTRTPDWFSIIHEAIPMIFKLFIIEQAATTSSVNTFLFRLLFSLLVLLPAKSYPSLSYQMTFKNFLIFLIHFFIKLIDRTKMRHEKCYSHQQKMKNEKKKKTVWVEFLKNLWVLNWMFR